MNRSFIYSLKVWLLMVIIAPLLHLVLSWFIIENPEISLIAEIQKDYIIFADMVLLLTIPFAFVFWVAVYSLSKKREPFYVKQVLTIAILIITMLPFFELLFEKKVSAVSSIAVIIFPYSITGIAGIWLHKLESPEPEEETVEEQE
ncbi:hypothetical protein DIU31_026195 [Mucilaginibacter rubeus]|uniref:Uncharacterized protein n=1 Tax=Mucilaginibacter rubeus TaxID=2027860 RepID=A0AAE6JL62_9SPHI|nr:MULTISPECIES: hypothetical protein [Mucilaginibacter]QEM06825.1 hypothetical protein DIU31_026195 [Mucilaginibacter rubeus]QEM19414.1 hypothetical protein DIU38_026490 [Mucilaginibacter gossypii]QTE44038.1 hypothetical protein J3L19_01245 [Mucilaginibacter rubeus]QTE50639.1 hypothetical protein J3L21_01225 [Mucilaginibacter rubeus]QTE55723.1 hypothetical protein J3L23_26460 [Mucilaginibacter rubeus]